MEKGMEKRHSVVGHLLVVGGHLLGSPLLAVALLS